MGNSIISLQILDAFEEVKVQVADAITRQEWIPTEENKLLEEAVRTQKK